MTATDKFLAVFFRIGLYKLFRYLNPNILTVLNYHRIDDPSEPGFNTFKPNVSATPLQFARQMDFLSQNYNVIAGCDLDKWLNGSQRLPPNAAIITFDDGYYDNLKNAFPILKARNLPAIIFLTTDYIGSSSPFFWDLVAYCFEETDKDFIDAPLFGHRSWKDDKTRKKVMDEWMAWAKTLPDDEKQKHVEQLPGVLNVSVPDDLSASLTLAWSDVRHLTEHGIEMGSHTASHPILTRVPLDAVTKELAESKKIIEEETKKPVLSFAYPNGQAGDFNDEIIARVRQTGYRFAFTLLSGPTRLATVRKSPFSIRRTFLSYKDTFPRFVGKLMGVSRLRS